MGRIEGSLKVCLPAIAVSDSIVEEKLGGMSLNDVETVGDEPADGVNGTNGGEETAE